MRNVAHGVTLWRNHVALNAMYRSHLFISNAGNNHLSRNIIMTFWRNRAIITYHHVAAISQRQYRIMHHQQPMALTAVTMLGHRISNVA